MKLTFKGFRGFGKDADFIEFSNLTILTGKNSSGKSTFLKLLDLLRNAFKDVNSFNEIRKIEINIANDILGGKENFDSLQKVDKVKMIFSTQIEFYIDYHEIHINFEISDYVLKVESLEIFDTKCLKHGIPFFTLESAFIKMDARYLFSKYKESAMLYNILEEYRFRTEVLSKQIFDNYVLQYDEQRKKLGLTDKILKNLVKKHISAKNDDDYVSNEPLEFKINVPFRIIDLPGENGYYNILYDAKNDDIDLTIEDIKKIVNLNHCEYSIKEFIAENNLNQDTFQLLKELYNNEIENILLDTKTLKYDSQDSLNYSILKNYLSNQQPEKKLLPLKNELLELEIDEGINLKDLLLSIKIELLVSLSEISAQIFEKYIVKFLKTMGNIEFQSNVRNFPERSYNIYNTNNVFSSFIKYWKILDKKEKYKKLHFIKTYLKLFEIAENVKIKIEGNTGYIQLFKNGNLISLIDEGSGVSNIISCLLFIATSLPTIEIEQSEYELLLVDNQILVLEEPESNLHPNLQSLLADLLVKVIDKYPISFIIETHSEYLIRKLQYLVAKQKISPDSISLNYFNMKYNGNSPFIKVKKIPISPDGRLEEEFGTGFFDEADNIAIQLFDIQKNRLN
jgi:predicted ATPase